MFKHLKYIAGIYFVIYLFFCYIDWHWIKPTDIWKAIEGSFEFRIAFLSCHIVGVVFYIISVDWDKTK